MTERIDEKDLALVTAAPTDELRAVRAGKSVRVPIGSLPASPAVQAQIDALAAGQAAGMLGFETKSDMDADLDHPEGTLALVTDDPDDTEDNPVNLPYLKVGASGTGSWEPSNDRTTRLAAEMSQRVRRSPPPPVETRAPVAVAGGKVLMWAADGRMEMAFGPYSIGFMDDELVGPRVQAFRNDVTAGRVPLAVSDGKAVLWASPSGIGFPSLEPATLDMVRDALGADESVVDAVAATDGHTLRKWRAKVGHYRAGVANTVMRIGFCGDSWAEFRNIPQVIRNRLIARYALSGDGYFTFKSGTHHLPEIPITLSGWTEYDASTAQTTPPPRSCGPCGHAIYTTGSSATVGITGLTGTNITIGYWNGNGTFRYRVDGGSWTTVAGTGANAVATVQITGLAAGTHALDIDTTGNTGTCELYFVMSEKPATSGVTMFKIGNGSMTGRGYTTIRDHIAQWSSLLNLDLLCMVLGTNDSRSSYSFADASNYAAGIIDLVVAHRSANPRLPVIFIIPPAHGDTVGPGALQDYWQAAHDTALALGIECYRACNTWDTHAVEDGRGLWIDTLHLNTSGAQRLGVEIDHAFLEV